MSTPNRSRYSRRQMEKSNNNNSNQPEGFEESKEEDRVEDECKEESKSGEELVDLEHQEGSEGRVKKREEVATTENDKKRSAAVSPGKDSDVKKARVDRSKEVIEIEDDVDLGKTPEEYTTVEEMTKVLNTCASSVHAMVGFNNWVRNEQEKIRNHIMSVKDVVEDVKAEVASLKVEVDRIEKEVKELKKANGSDEVFEEEEDTDEAD